MNTVRRGSTKRIALLGALAVAFAIGGASAQTQDDELASPKLRVEWAPFKAKYDAKAIVIVDVRDTTSYEIGHIPGARSIPLPDIERELDNLKKIRKPIVVYCA